MPDESSPREQFPHLHLIHRDIGPAKFPPGFPQDARVKANRLNRVTHSARLKQSLHQLAANWHRRNDERQAQGLPVIKSGIPFVIEVADGFNLDELVAHYQVEIVAVEELLDQSGGHRYVLVSATAIDGSELLQIVEGFATEARGSATVAGMVEILDDPEDPRRLEAILSPRLRQAWPFPPDEELLLDVSFQTRGILADLGDKPRKSRKGTKEAHAETLAVWFETNKTRLFQEWDAFSMELEHEIQSIITAHGGEIVNQWEDGQWAVTAARVSFPDSISMRVTMRGRGFTDLILNHPRIFEVREPDETEGIDPSETTQPEDSPTFRLQPPSVGAPLVCVIDSGMQEGHRLLKAAVAKDKSVCLLPGKLPADIVDEVTGGGHGTRVGGAVLYPEAVPTGGEESARCWLGNARVLGADQKLPDALYPPSMLERIIGHFFDCRIFVHSINATTPCPTHRMSAWATKMDELSYTHDSLFVVSAGNLDARRPVPGKGFLDHLCDGASHPNYLLTDSARVATPAQSLQALTVGSVAAATYDDGFWKSVAQAEHPSCFSRTGLGIWDTVKPDVVEFGGDCCIPRNGLPTTKVEKEATSPHLVRSTLHGGPEVGRDAVGTSFAAPKVAALAAELQRLLPDQSTLLYRALIANAARWPEWAGVLPLEERVRAFRWIGYGRPDWNRALINSESRVTLITSEALWLRAGEAAVFEVPIPESLRTPGAEKRLRIDVTLSYATEPRRTRSSLKGYQAVWLDWMSSRLREPVDLFLHRMWKDVSKPAISAEPGSIPWMLSDKEDTGRSRKIRRQGTLQKDWAVISGFDLPESFSIAVRGHRGWNAADPSASARFALIVSIEAENPEIRVYEPVRIELERIENQRLAAQTQSRVSGS